MRHILTEVWCCSRRMSQVVLKWVNMFQKVSKTITCKCDKRMLLKKRLPRSMISTVATCTRPSDTSVHSFVTTPTPTDHQTFTLRDIWPLPCGCYGDHFVIWIFQCCVHHQQIQSTDSTICSMSFALQLKHCRAHQIRSDSYISILLYEVCRKLLAVLSWPHRLELHQSWKLLGLVSYTYWALASLAISARLRAIEKCSTASSVE